MKIAVKVMGKFQILESEIWRINEDYEPVTRLVYEVVLNSEGYPYNVLPHSVKTEWLTYDQANELMYWCYDNYNLYEGDELRQKLTAFLKLIGIE